MKKDEVFPSVWLKAADLCGAEPVVTIEACTKEVVDKKTGKTQPVLTFEGKSKQLGLNVTNFSKIVELTGEDDTDNWIGKKIKLFGAMVDFKGESTLAIRIKSAETKKQAAPAASKDTKSKFVASLESKDEDNMPPETDEVPF